jgi:hypothetical protein
MAGTLGEGLLSPKPSPLLAVPFAQLWRGNPEAFGVTTPVGDCITKREPLLPGLYADHLAGRLDLGVVPIMPGDRCWWGAIDLDGGVGDRDAAYRLRSRIGGQYKLPASVFTSRRRGYHVVVFFDQPARAWLVREVLVTAVAEERLPTSTEVFPKQVSLAPGAVGNFLRLPYYPRADPGRRVALGGDGEPIDLADWLRLVQRATVKQLKDVATGLGLSRPPEARPQLHIVGRLPVEPPQNLPVLPAAVEDLGLTGPLADLAEHGWREGCGYRTRSEAQQAVLVALVNLGHPDPVLWAVLSHDKWKIGERTSETGRRRADYARSIQRAREYAETNPLTRRSGAVPLEAWARLKGDPLAFMVLATVARHVNRETDWAMVTVKGLGRSVGRSEPSIKRAIGRLKAAGLLAVDPLPERWPTGRPKHAYRVLVPAAPVTDDPHNLNSTRYSFPEGRKGDRAAGYSNQPQAVPA